MQEKGGGEGVEAGRLCCVYCVCLSYVRSVFLSICFVLPAVNKSLESYIRCVALFSSSFSS